MLTQDEKKVVALCLAQTGSARSTWIDTAPYLLSPIVFGAYGLWSQDLSALALAFALLLLFSLLYLSYQARTAKHLVSALRKYEDAVHALAMPDADQTRI